MAGEGGARLQNGTAIFAHAGVFFALSGICSRCAGSLGFRASFLRV